MNKRRFLTFILTLLALTTGVCASAESVETTPIRATAETLTEMLYDQTLWSETPSFQAFNGVTLTGEAINQDIFSDYQITMINIWATFCSPCISEMPDLAKLNDAYGEGEFQVIGVVLDVLDQNGVGSDALDFAWRVVETTGANYTHLLPSYDLSLVKLNDVTAVPETLFVDSEGNLLTPDTQYLGAKSYDEWKSIIDSLLAAQRS